MPFTAFLFVPGKLGASKDKVLVCAGSNYYMEQSMAVVESFMD